MSETGPLTTYSPADVDRLVEHAGGCGVEVDTATAARLLDYLAAMLDENRRVNLTAIRDPAAAFALHAADSLAGLGLVDATPRRAVDLGTGNGFPGVAVAVRSPGTAVTLVDRTAKKLDAIGRALARVGIDNATTLWLDAAQTRARAPDEVGRYDLVVCRAVAEPRDVGRLAKPLLHRDGALLLWLAAETAAPSDLSGGLRRRAEREYALPDAEGRRRRVALYRGSEQAWGPR